MDGQRFDQIARTFVSRTGRRRFLKGVVGVLFGAAAARVADDAEAACKGYGRSCAAASECCPSLTCDGGRCKCAAGQEKCTASGAVTCVAACPLDSQYMGSDCRCLCLSTGRPPENGQCPCPAGQTDCGDGICKDLSSDPSSCGACGSVCPVGLLCRAGKCFCTADSQCPESQFCDENTGTCRGRFRNFGFPCNRHRMCQNNYCNAEGICACNGTYRLSGGPDPNTPIVTDDDLKVYRNGGFLLREGFGSHLLDIPADIGSSLGVDAVDTVSGRRGISPVYVHCLVSGQYQVLDPVGVPSEPSTDPVPFTFFSKSIIINI